MLWKWETTPSFSDAAVGLANFAFFQVDLVDVINICDGSVIKQVYSINTTLITNYMKNSYVATTYSLFIKLTKNKKQAEKTIQS